MGDAGVETQHDLARLIAMWRKRPDIWIRNVLGADPEQYQIEALQALESNDKVAMRSGHGVGKTTTLAWAIIWFMMTRKECKVPCTAPAGGQLDTVLWPEIRKWVREMADEYKEVFEFEITGDMIRMKGLEENFAAARTARREQPEALQGFHSANLLFAVDEAPGVPDEVFETVEGALSSHGSKVLLTGNPSRLSGYFFDSFHVMSNMFYNIHVSCKDSSRVSQQFIDAKRERSGADSNEFRIRVLGEFPLQEEETIVPRAKVEAAVGRDIAGSGPIYWGIDPAAQGKDKTALAIRQGPVLYSIENLPNLDTRATSERIIEMYRFAKDRPAEIAVDSIGIGKGVADNLRWAGLPVREVNVGEASSDKGRFVRLRDELWAKASEWFRYNNVSIPTNVPDFIFQVSSVCGQYTEANKYKVEGKDKTYERIRRSPDDADAFIMTFACTRGIIGMPIQEDVKMQTEYDPFEGV